MARRDLLLLPIVMLVVAGCDARPRGQSPSEPTAKSSNAVQGRVTRREFEARGKRWPLSVDEGILGCSGMARWIEVEGARYGLNGFATVDQGYREIEPIWAADEAMGAQLKAAGVPNDPPLRVNIGDMIEEAGRPC